MWGSTPAFTYMTIGRSGNVEWEDGSYIGVYVLVRYGFHWNRHVLGHATQ